MNSFRVLNLKHRRLVARSQAFNLFYRYQAVGCGSPQANAEAVAETLGELLCTAQRARHVGANLYAICASGFIMEKRVEADQRADLCRIQLKQFRDLNNRCWGDVTIVPLS